MCLLYNTNRGLNQFSEEKKRAEEKKKLNHNFSPWRAYHNCNILNRHPEKQCLENKSPKTLKRV